MSWEEYSAALQAAVIEREQLIKQRDAINTRLLQLDANIRSLAVLAAQTEAIQPLQCQQVSLRDAIGAVFRNAGGQPLSPVEVRNTLLAMGFDLSGLANQMSAIHNTLRRMVPSELSYVANMGKYVLNRF
jgi:hypothetical protein